MFYKQMTKLITIVPAVIQPLLFCPNLSSDVTRIRDNHYQRDMFSKYICRIKIAFLGPGGRRSSQMSTLLISTGTVASW